MKINLKIKEIQLLAALFKNVSKKDEAIWDIILHYSDVKFFKEGIVAVWNYQGVCYINSASIEDKPFSISMRKYLLNLIEEYENLFVATILPNLNSLKKRGFIYSKKHSLYYRGEEAYDQLMRSEGGT